MGNKKTGFFESVLYIIGLDIMYYNTRSSNSI